MRYQGVAAWSPLEFVRPRRRRIGTRINESDLTYSFQGFSTKEETTMNASRMCRALVFLPMIGLMFLSAPLLGQETLPTPRYVPPDIVSEGIQAHYADLAIIETNCQTYSELRVLWRTLIERGALVTVVTSPGRMLAWVPAEARDAVRETRLSGVNGEIAVQSISYTCLLYTSPSPRDRTRSRMPSSA